MASERVGPLEPDPTGAGTAEPHPAGHPGPFGPIADRMDSEHRHDASARDVASIERAIGAVRAYTRYFSPEVRGLEHVPAAGPALVVGNHNCLFYMPDTWIAALAIIGRRGMEHPAYCLVHDFLVAIPGVGAFLRSLGAVPARPGKAESLLREGALVLDYPGGDREACRPWLRRNTIDFEGRTGFVRLALRTGVPVVPVVAHGSHDAVVVLSRGERIARLLGLRVLRLDVFPIVLGPFGPSTILTPPLPLPSSVTVEFLPPVDWSTLGPAAAEDPEIVERCAEEVVGRMQASLDALAFERAHPVRRGIGNLVKAPLLALTPLT